MFFGGTIACKGTETETETETDRDRQTDPGRSRPRQAQTDTERQTDTQRQTSQPASQAGRQTDTQTDRDRLLTLCVCSSVRPARTDAHTPRGRLRARSAVNIYCISKSVLYHLYTYHLVYTVSPSLGGASDLGKGSKKR